MVNQLYYNQLHLKSKLLIIIVCYCTSLPTEPNMKWMHKLIIPRVSYCWRKLADYLDYPVEKKREIEERQRGDPYKCCAELMEDWLTSDRGVTPKTWHTLVSVIKEVAELKSSAKSIEQLLLKEGLLCMKNILFIVSLCITMYV